jgi:branched-chain amino acid transport system permease protein
MQQVGQLVVNGLLLGSIYAIVAAGFALVYGVMNVLNVAHGALIMAGAFATYTITTVFGVEPLLVLPITMILLFGLGYVIQRILVERVLDYSIFMVFILTYGLDLLLTNIAFGIWGGTLRSVDSALTGEGFRILGVHLPYVRLIVLAWTTMAIVGLLIFMSKTRLGLAIKATSLDREAAQLAGIDVRQVYGITFGISAALGGAAGCLLSNIYPVTPFMGVPFLTRAFAVAVLGGLGSVTGALYAGFILAAAEIVGVLVLGGGWADGVAFLVLMLVLVLRPQGLLGKKFFAEVEV